MRVVSLLGAILILSSCVIIPVSASESISIEYTSTTNKIWFPSSSTSIKTVNSTYYSVEHNNDDGYIVITPDNPDFYDLRQEGIASHGWSVFKFNVIPTVDLSSINLDDYDLVIDWRVNNNYSDVSEGLTTNEKSNLTADLGITDSSMLAVNGAVPSINGICGYDLSEYYDVYVTFSGDTCYSTYTFTDTDTITDILDGSYVVQLPFNNLNSQIMINYNMTLEPASSDDASGDISSGILPDDYVSKVDFTTPALYDYDIKFSVDIDAGKTLTDYSVIDFYSSGNSTKMRDYTDKFVLTSQPLMLNYYDALLGIGYADGVTYDEYFTDGLFDMYQLELPYTVTPLNYTFDTLDMSLAGFRMEFYISFPSGFIYDSYKSLIDSANMYFYTFEPFSFKVGNTTIPYDYFTFSYDVNQTALRATLELDGKNMAHRNFMNLIAEYYSDNITLTFTLPVTQDAGLMVGFTRGGFWKKYADPVIPDETTSPDSTTAPTVTPDDGISQDDVDNAYNQGYNQGVSDGSDKNYVFGFVNGMFNGVNTLYKTLANGISIGGITLGSIITSIIIIVVLSVILKKVI